MRPGRHSSPSTISSGVKRCAVCLPVRAAKRFQHSNPSFCFVFPSPILDGLPVLNAIWEKLVWGGGYRDSLLATVQEGVTIWYQGVSRWAQETWHKKYSLSVCIGFRTGPIYALSQTVRVLPHPHCSVENCFSISEQFFSDVAPHCLSAHDSPSNLAGSRYPHGEWLPAPKLGKGDPLSGRVAVPIPAVASASVFHSTAVGGSVVDVVRPL